MKFWHDFSREGSSNFAAEHYERDYDLAFRLKADQNLVVEHCEGDFYMIFNFKEAQHLVAERYEWFSALWWLKTWLQSIMEEDSLAGLILLWQWTKIGSI